MRADKKVWEDYDAALAAARMFLDRVMEPGNYSDVLEIRAYPDGSVSCNRLPAATGSAGSDDIYLGKVAGIEMYQHAPSAVVGPASTACPRREPHSSHTWYDRPIEDRERRSLFCEGVEARDDVETPVSPYESGRLACGARHMVDGYVSECHREAMHDGPHESVTRLGHEQRWTTGVGSASLDRDTLMQVIAKATYHEANGGVLGFQFQGWTPEMRYEFAQRVVERYEAVVVSQTVEPTEDNDQRWSCGGDWRGTVWKHSLLCAYRDDPNRVRLPSSDKARDADG